MIVIIDNYDSFTYNIVQTIAAYVIEELHAEMVVFRNDEVDVRAIASLKPERLLVSPGPCTPAQAGISIAAIQYFSDSGIGCLSRASGYRRGLRR